MDEMSTAHDDASRDEVGGVSQALYRTYRPGRLSEVVGQEHVKAALSSALAHNRVGHAYLFSGPRGTGKTSVARILARSLNCGALVDGEPCGVCWSCRGIAGGSSLDVVELDAASNSGVDSIRDLISSAQLGTAGNKRVYIIDEVHMLSNAASNALLKTLEEPPSHVVFILATTDPNKVLPTVRSRTQHLEFALVGSDELALHLREVADKAGLAVSDEIINEAVRRGAGSVRDALSALEVLVGTGVVARPGSGALVAAIVQGDQVGVLVAVAEAVAAGSDCRVLAEEALSELRDYFLIQMGAGELVLASNLDEVTKAAAELGPKRTVMAMDALGDAIMAMRGDHDKRINLEVCLSRYCKLVQAAG
jgi:DNA polymerase-3 subunit gamma/tau